jgi:hypothetical protein
MTLLLCYLGIDLLVFSSGFGGYWDLFQGVEQHLWIRLFFHWTFEGLDGFVWILLDQV